MNSQCLEYKHDCKGLELHVSQITFLETRIGNIPFDNTILIKNIKNNRNKSNVRQTMKLYKAALYLITTAVAVAAADSNLRGKDTTPEGKLLAHVEITPTATVDMLLLEEDDIVVLSAQADPKSAMALEKALEAAEDDEDMVSVFKKISGQDEVPSELAEVADRMQAMALKLDSQEDPLGPPPPEDDEVVHIDDPKTVVEHDGDDDEGEDDDDGNERRLGFCTGYRSCKCYTYITNNWTTNTKRGTRMFSHLQPYRGSLRHSIFVWKRRGYWSRTISRYVSPGTLSKIRSWDTNGRLRYWKASTTYAYRDGYHWRFC